MIQKLLDQLPESVKNLQDVQFLLLELLSHFALHSNSVATPPAPTDAVCLWCGDLSAESHAEQASETKMAATMTRGAVSLMTTREHS